MKKRFSEIIFLLVFVLVIFMKKTVVSVADSRIQAEKEFYHKIESEYLKETRETLKESGYINSGVNLTKVIDEEGRRTYTVRIHNRRINALEETEREELLDTLRGICFADEQCEFYHEFITIEK